MDRRTALRTLLAGGGTLLASRYGVLAPAFGQTSESAPSGRLLFPFDFEWKFLLGNPAGAEAFSFDDNSWRPLSLPHDWSIEGPFEETNPSGMPGGWAPIGIGWYRKLFGMPSTFRGKRLVVDFEGVYQNCQVWINGSLLGKQYYGYSGFQFDLTPHIRFDEGNVLAVRVDNSTTYSRWYSGSGIYRHVRLLITDNLRVERWGVYVRTPVATRTLARVVVTTSVLNDNDAARNCELQTTLLDAEGRVVAGPLSQAASAPAAGKAEFEQQFEFSDPKLWSPATPSLHFVHTRVLSNGVTVDEYFTPFGVREVRLDKDEGFLLNGQSIKMKGVCMHHDLGALGAAAFDRAIERRLEILKSIGCNAIRTSHNPPAAALLDLCDRMGFLVIDEAFDKWGIGVFEGVESPDFAESWQKDLRAMLRRDRNHPSVVFWSVGNEAGYPGSDAHDGMLKQLVDFVHREEPSRPVTCALVPVEGNPWEVAEKMLRSGTHTDVLAVNYQDAYYDLFRTLKPDVVVIGTEAAPFFRMVSDPFHSALINSWYAAQDRKFVIGHFVWNGFDYLGESFVWPNKGWASGIIDTCGFPKGQAYFFQSRWSDQPVVRALVIDSQLEMDPVVPAWSSPPAVSHWNFAPRAGEIFAIYTPSNCETVELILNGASYGEQRPADSQNHTAVWYVPYTPGILVAIGRNKGEIVAGHGLRTSGAPARILLRPDRLSLKADGHDLSHIEVSVVDAEEIPVPDSDTLITIRVEGEGRLAAVDDGRLRSRESFQEGSRTTRLGRCLAVVQAGRQPGRIVVTAISRDLPAASIALDVVAS